MYRPKMSGLLHPAILGCVLLGVIAGVFVVPAGAVGWKCPVEEVTQGSCTWTAQGCLRNEEGIYMCLFTPSSSSCPSNPPAGVCEETFID
jgi:hypothetical protein